MLDADLVVVGIGVAPEHRLARGLGPHARQRRGVRRHLPAAPGVVAAGDVARWPNHRFDEVMRVEHWDNAIAMGAHAARTLLAGDGRREPYDAGAVVLVRPVRPQDPAGRASPAPDDACEVVSGSVEERRFVALYGRGGRVVGVLGMNQPGQGHALAVAGRGGASLGRRAATAAAAVECQRAVTGGRLPAASRSPWLARGRSTGSRSTTGSKALEYVCKPLTLVLLIGVALALDPDDPTVRAWFVVALVLSPGRRRVPDAARRTCSCSGWASFLLGHIAYIVGMHVDGRRRPPLPRRDRDRDGPAGGDRHAASSGASGRGPTPGSPGPWSPTCA